ncbi:hypothetical protein DRP07_07780 [Archaeoglobales archaeon]|nr:MAG: hypothetical protein DRP07_07780 [Archaeoglobales archaeon]
MTLNFISVISEILNPSLKKVVIKQNIQLLILKRWFIQKTESGSRDAETEGKSNSLDPIYFLFIETKLHTNQKKQISRFSSIFLG